MFSDSENFCQYVEIFMLHFLGKHNGPQQKMNLKVNRIYLTFSMFIISPQFFAV